MADIRHLIAHARMQVLGDFGATFNDFQISKDGLIHHRTKRIGMAELEDLAQKAARFSRIAQLLAERLEAESILPPL